MTCAFITHRDCRLHEMGEGHPEVPRAARRDLRLPPLHWRDEPPHSHEAPRPRPRKGARARDALRKRELMASAARRLRALDPDTSMNSHSLTAAAARGRRRGAGDGPGAEGRREPRVPRGAPPGHHATREAAMASASSTTSRWAFATRSTSTVSSAWRSRRFRRAPRQRLRGHSRRRRARAHGLDLPARSLSLPRQRAPRPQHGEHRASRPDPGRRSCAARSRNPGARAPRRSARRRSTSPRAFDAHRADENAGLRWVEDDYAWITRSLVEVAERSLRRAHRLVPRRRVPPLPPARSVAAHVKEPRARREPNA